MKYPLPTPGSDSTLIGRAPVWRDIVSMIAEWKAGRFYQQRQPKRRGTIWIKNDTGRDVEPGELLQVSFMSEPSDSSLGIATNYSPILSAIEPTWHTDIDNIVIADSPVIDGEFFPYNTRSYGIVSCTASNGRYVMVDPTNPQYGTPSDSGIFRILGYDSTNDFAIVDRSQSQNLWKYELTQDSLAPSATSAKLLNLDGTEYATTITLTDPDGLMDDQVSGDQGFCLHIGNKFFAIQAVCA